MSRLGAAKKRARRHAAVARASGQRPWADMTPEQRAIALPTASAETSRLLLGQLEDDGAQDRADARRRALGRFGLAALALAIVLFGADLLRRHPETGSGGHGARSDAGHPTASGPSPSQADGGGR